jgi:hypothetical protein
MGMKQLDLRLPVDQARDAAQAVFGNAIGALECFGKKQQGLLNRGCQVREAQDLAHTRARDATFGSSQEAQVSPVLTAD